MWQQWPQKLVLGVRILAQQANSFLQAFRNIFPPSHFPELTLLIARTQGSSLMSLSLWMPPTPSYILLHLDLCHLKSDGQLSPRIHTTAFSEGSGCVLITLTLKSLFCSILPGVGVWVTGDSETTYDLGHHDVCAVTRECLSHTSNLLSGSWELLKKSFIFYPCRSHLEPWISTK